MRRIRNRQNPRKQPKSKTEIGPTSNGGAQVVPPMDTSKDILMRMTKEVRGSLSRDHDRVAH
jgi:hypothetical protein